MFWIGYIVAFAVACVVGLVYANIKPHEAERMY